MLNVECLAIEQTDEPYKQLQATMRLLSNALHLRGLEAFTNGVTLIRTSLQRSIKLISISEMEPLRKKHVSITTKPTF